MNKILYLLVLIFCAISCGAPNSSNSEGNIQVKSLCPKTPSNYHDVILFSAAAIPNKVSIVLDGEQKLDECPHAQPLPPPVPVIRVSRESNKLLMRVIHMGAYPTLPKVLDIQIYNRSDCKKQIPYFSAQAPLVFNTEYPNGEMCPGVSVARVELQQ